MTAGANMAGCSENPLPDEAHTQPTALVRQPDIFHKDKSTPIKGCRPQSTLQNKAHTARRQDLEAREDIPIQSFNKSVPPAPFFSQAVVD